MAEHPRERMIESALVLMGEHGVEATSFSQVIEHSGAPRGSIYHHFPGGKEQLIEEATRYGGDVGVKLLTEAIEQHAPVAPVAPLGGVWHARPFPTALAARCPRIAAPLHTA